MISETATTATLGAALCVVLLSSCSTPTDIFALRCDVTVSNIAPQPAAQGEAVTVTGTPFTSTYDSAVYVGNARAAVVDVARTGCDTCDSCRSQAGCTECSDCDACDAICANECVETITFTVPDVAPGMHGLQLFNAHGQTPVMELYVESTGYPGRDSEEGDTADTGNPSALTASSPL
jgi:hypothetical protein